MSRVTWSSRGLGVLMVALSAPACASLVGADFDGLHRRRAHDAGADLADARHDATGADEAGTPSDSDAGSLPAPPPIRVESPNAETTLLGLSVAVDGDTALVGARTPDRSGEVFVVKRNPANGVWQIAYSLASLGPKVPDSQLGGSVALAGDHAVVGARGDELGTQPGFAVFYRRTNETLEPTLKVQAPAPAPGDGYGRRVAMKGDLAVVGAPGASFVDVFRRGADGTWGLEQTLTSPGAPGDGFGSELGVHADTLVVSAPDDDGRGNDAGIVYVYARRDGAWVQEATLTAPDTNPTGMRFGDGTIGFDGDSLLVPAFYASTDGKVRLFSRAGDGTFTPTALEPPPYEVDTSGFGYRASVRGDVAVLTMAQSNDEGAAFVYRSHPDGFRCEARLAPNGRASDVFGWTVAFDGATAVVGAIHYRELEGAAYFFDLTSL